MSTSSRLPGCPSHEDLSAAADGQIPEELSLHLESCAACQRELAILHRIDRALRSRLAPPAGLAERVRQRVRQAAAAPVATAPAARPQWWVSPVLRLAAAVVITAAAIAVLVHMLNGGAQPGRTVVANDALPGRAPSAIEPVSVAAAGEASETSRAVRGPQSLPRLVRHVWTVGNAPGERRRLEAMLPEGSYEVDTAEGNTVFTVSLTDRDLQTLVDRLAENSAWQLASPELPQPRQPRSVSLTGRNVRYSLVLVDNSSSAP